MRQGLVLSVVFLVTLATAATYPTFQGDFARTGQIPKGGEVPMTNLGTYAAGSPIIGSCSKAQNLLLFGSDKSALHAVDAFSGTESWKLTTKDSIYGAPTAEEETVYAGSLDHHLYVLDRSSGNVKKDIDMGGEIHGSVAIDEQNIYVAVSHPRNALVVLDKTTFAEKKEKKFSQPILSSPVLSGNTLIVTPNDQHIYALDKNSLSVLWQKDTGATTGFYTATVYGNSVYVVGADFNNSLFSLDLATGSENWKIALSTDTFIKASSLATTADRVYVVAGAGTVKIYALNPSTGAVLWSNNIGAVTSYSFLSSPIATSTHLFVATPDGNFKVYDKDGSETQSFALGNAAVASPCGSSGIFAVGDLGGTFHIFKVQNDTTLPSASITSPSKNGTVGKTFSVTGTADDTHFKQYQIDVKDSLGNTVISTTGYEEVANGKIASLTTPNTGSYTVRLLVVDVLDNTKEVSVSFTSDHTPPTLTVSSPADGIMTNASKVTVQGNTDGTSLTINGQNVVLDGQGNFSMEISLQEGSNTLTLIATNALGNTLQKTLTINRDTVAPTLTIVSPADKSQTNQSQITVSGSVSGAASLTVNGTPVSFGSDGKFSTTVSLQEGSNAITIEAKDASGNTTKTTLSLTRDSAAPTLTVSSPTNGFKTTISSVEVKGTTEAGATLLINNASVSLDSSGKFSKTITLTEGSNTITVTAKDSAGNQTEKKITVTFLSKEGPLTVTNPKDGTITTQKRVKVDGTSYDLTALTVNGNTVSLDSSGSFSTEVSLVEGENSISVEGTLTSGTKTTIVRKVTLDTTPPEGSIAILAGAYTNQKKLSIQLTGQDATGIKEVYLSEDATFAQKTTTAFTKSGMQASFTLSSGDGNKTVYARFFDLSGNSTDAQGKVFLDTQTPVSFTLTPDLPKPYLTGKKEIALSFSGADNEGGSGLKEVWLSEDTTFGTKVTSDASSGSGNLTFTLSEEDGEKTLYGRLIDLAGNSKDLSLTITLDTQGVIVIPLAEAIGDLKAKDGTILTLEAGSLKVKTKSSKQYLIVREPQQEISDPEDPDLKPTDVVKEILIVDENGSELEVLFTKPIYLTLSYKNTKKLNALAKNYRIFQWTGSEWEILEGKQEVDTAQTQVKAPLSSTGTFRLMNVNPSQNDFIAQLFNYPNPYGGTAGTTITYKLKNDAPEVRIEIYSVSGSKLSTFTLFQGQRGALIGRNRVKFSGRTETGNPLTNGVYFYRIVSVDDEGHQSSKVGKMVILR